MSTMFRSAALAASLLTSPLLSSLPVAAQTPASPPAAQTPASLHAKRTAQARPAATAASPAATPSAGVSPGMSPGASPGASAAPALPDPPIPTQHAVRAGMGHCVRAVDQLARAELGTSYNAQSTWNQANPGDHVFQSVAGLRNARNNPQTGVVAIIAAPVVNNTCDAVTVEVYPLAASCTEARKLILKGGEVETSLEDVRVLTDGQKRRLLLLPGAGSTCVALSLNSFYGPPGAPQ